MYLLATWLGGCHCEEDAVQHADESCGTFQRWGRIGGESARQFIRACGIGHARHKLAGAHELDLRQGWGSAAAARLALRPHDAVAAVEAVLGAVERRVVAEAVTDPIAGEVRKAGAVATRDIAAGALMIREAGGRISDYRGTDKYLENGNVVAGNPRIYAELSKLLAPYARNLP